MMDILINTYDTMAKILLVEDEVNIASFIERGLREFGHEVYVAYDGATGWELTQKNDFQLLILDIIMPKMNGLQLCKQYRQRFGYHAPVIMLTARSEEYDKLTGLESGADDYVVKPFSPNDLVPAIEVAISRYEQIRALEKEVGTIRDQFETRKLVDRAKSPLITKMNLTEPEAFRWIQKTSMDRRLSMREVSDTIIKQLSA